MSINTDVLDKVFLHTSSCYKYYWALSLLDLVKDGRTMCSMDEAVIGMMVRAWKPAMEGVSLGGMDRLYEKVREVQVLVGLKQDSTISNIKYALVAGLDRSEVRKVVRLLENNVPYRFLSPWITYITDEDVRSKSSWFENGCPYGLTGQMIVMNPDWETYLMKEYIKLIYIVEIELDGYINKICSIKKNV